jgi:hypothetical protein
MPVDGVKSKVAPVVPVCPVHERRGRDEEGVPQQGAGNDEFKKILRKECLKKVDGKNLKDNPPAAQIEPPLVLPAQVNADVDVVAGLRGYQDSSAAQDKWRGPTQGSSKMEELMQ